MNQSTPMLPTEGTPGGRKKGEKLDQIVFHSSFCSVDSSKLHEKQEGISQEQESKDIFEYDEKYENDDGEVHDENNHDEEYENDSFIIDDNGVTNDHDLTSTSASSLSGEDYQSQDEVSNSPALQILVDLHKIQVIMSFVSK